MVAGGSASLALEFSQGLQPKCLIVPAESLSVFLALVLEHKLVLLPFHLGGFGFQRSEERSGWQASEGTYRLSSLVG